MTYEGGTMLARIRKALVAALAAFVSALVAATVQKGGTPGGPELLAAALIALAAGWAVWKVRNAAPPR